MRWATTSWTVQPGSPVSVGHFRDISPPRRSSITAHSSSRRQRGLAPGAIGLVAHSGTFRSVVCFGPVRSKADPAPLVSGPRGDEGGSPTVSRRLTGLSLGSIPGHGGQIGGLDAVALELGEVVVARQPRNVSPQVDRVLIRRQLADHGPKMAGPLPLSRTIVGTPKLRVLSISPRCSSRTACQVPGSESASSHHPTSRPTSSSAARTAVAMSCSGGDCSQILLPSAV